MLQTTEFIVAAFKTRNAYELAKADGRIDGNDIQFAIPLFFAWQEGIKDLRFASEAANATPESIEAMFDTAGRELTALKPGVAYIYTQAAKGYYCTYWGIARPAFEAGKKDAEKAILRRLEIEGPEAVIASLRA